MCHICSLISTVYCSWFKMKNACTKCVLSIGDPSPPPLSTLVDTNVIHMIKWTRPSLSNQQLDDGKAWEQGYCMCGRQYVSPYKDHYPTTHWCGGHSHSSQISDWSLASLFLYILTISLLSTMNRMDLDCQSSLPHRVSMSLMLTTRMKRTRYIHLYQYHIAVLSSTVHAVQ